ncbi:twin-arginine translocation signal domain-containing protein [Natronosalvus rutilus]|uniref:Twin-arginine translocation signal domain-containing protein n=1 Tax=Natronosalvus rutilus TaxID=2953753 RepID=A0A9E7N9T8_9EURY|nr:twin-arginine translocation signal domain-containing protein [Natronosalvus rutilus]UTF52747.1 twin-arginine translocation signal domain-containing protein [Natronosalvus rutilus]
MTTNTNTISRRDAMKGAGAAAGVLAGVPQLTRIVSATDSGDPELTLFGTIPSDGQIDVTVEEYDTEGSESPLNTETVTVTDTGSAHPLENIDGAGSYYYVHDGTLTRESDSPELETLRLEIPADPEDFDNVDYTDVLEWEHKAESTTIEYDEWYLRNYQPQLNMALEERDRMNGMYAYVARSEEENTDVLCYWVYLDRESEADEKIRTGSDLGDHQPIYVFVNDAGKVEKIVYSAFHWYTATITPGPDVLWQDRKDDPAHAAFEMTPHGHFMFNATEPGDFYELKPWPEVRDVWKNNTFYSRSKPNTIENPWEIGAHDHWWAESFDTLYDRLYVKLGQWFGWYGADEADL